MYETIKVNEALLAEIDKTVLDDRRVAWKQAVKEAPYTIYTDRAKYATESWKETVDMDIQLRRAYLFEKICDNVDIDILEYDCIIGRVGPKIVGNHPSIDINGDYLDGLWEDDGIEANLHEKATVSKEDLEILREAARTFKGDSPVDHVNKAWQQVYGDWPALALKNKLKDPDLTSGNFGNSSHTIDFEKLLTKGLRYYINEAQAHIDDYYANHGQNPDQFFFWKSAIICCEAMIRHSHRYAALAREKAAVETNPERKAELLDAAQMCEHVPEFPARSFKEALQSMVMGGMGKALEHPQFNQPHWGRVDHYLYPFFINDINAGKLTAQEAMSYLSEVIGRWGTQLFIIGNLLYRQTHQVTYGINAANLGGLNPDGSESANELSYLFLHAVGKLHQSSPSVTINWNVATPNWLMKKAIETNILTGGGIPLFQNDEMMVDAYVKDGYSLEEARTWVGRGCVWPGLPQRSEYKGGFAGFNGAAVLHMTLHNGHAVTGDFLGIETGDPRNFKTFEDLWDAYVAQHKYAMDRCLWLCDIAREVAYHYVRLPALSVLSIQQCMDAGRDTVVPDLHCEYATTDRAIIDNADSLMAIKKLVFDEKKLTMAELMDALDSNFEGERGQEIRHMCLNCPKYGNDIEEVDQLAKRIGEMSAKSVTEWDHAPYPHFKSLREGLSWHYAAGLGCGASANGRYALEPLNDASASPMRGMDKNGPTAALRSVLNADFGKNSYVVALNQKFPRNIINTPDGIQKLIDYTGAFLKAGGTHIQYNISDNKELKDAQINPAEHQDLIVRVGGFSAYFVQLSQQIQNDVIGRQEHIL